MATNLSVQDSPSKVEDSKDAGPQPKSAVDVQADRKLLKPRTVQQYFNSLESRVGYRLFLNGTRHWGYHDSATSSAFPIDKALRAMESQLIDALKLPAGSDVLDSGCGDGYVGIHLARQCGWIIDGIDIMDRHVSKALANVKSAGLDTSINIAQGDYHDLSKLSSCTYDGAYTMETLMHATDVKLAISELARVLKPGGVYVLHEYEFFGVQVNQGFNDYVSAAEVSRYGAVPQGGYMERGYWRQQLEAAGFEDIEVRDLTENVTPLVKVVHDCAYLPVYLVKLFGAERRLINTISAVGAYRSIKGGMWHYLQVRGRKRKNAVEKTCTM